MKKLIMLLSVMFLSLSLFSAAETESEKDQVMTDLRANIKAGLNCGTNDGTPYVAWDKRKNKKEVEKKQKTIGNYSEGCAAKIYKTKKDGVGYLHISGNNCTTLVIGVKKTKHKYKYSDPRGLNALLYYTSQFDKKSFTIPPEFMEYLEKRKAEKKESDLYAILMNGSRTNCEEIKIAF